MPPAPPRSALLALYLGLTRVVAPFVPAMLRRTARAGAADPARLAQMLGHADRPRPDGRVIWVHAASLGEGLAALPLIAALTQGGARVVLTTTTVTAAGMLAGRLPAGTILQAQPVDVPGAIRRFLRHWRPELAVLIEAELWPRLIHDVHAAGVPVALAGARMSDRSARRWARMGRLGPALMGRLAAVTVADAAMADRFAALGVARDRLHVTGALKDAAAPLPLDRAERDRMAAALAGRALWLAASTHPGEEEVVAEAQRIAAAAVPGLALVLAPRHPERGPAIAAMLAARGLRVARRAAGQMPDGTTDVYLADTLGEMGLWFDLCPVTFLGGSLVPVGGHNALEPARMGSAILHGGQVANFAPLYADLDRAGAARAVGDAAALAAAVVALQDPQARAAMTAAARAVADRPGDTADRTAAILRALIPPGPRPTGPSAALP